MAKNEWTVFVNNMLKRKRANRNHKLPKDYIEALADKIHRTNPTKAILVNTLSEFAEELISKGYSWRISDSKFFKDKKVKHLKEDWDKEITAIEDEMFNKNGK